MKYGIFILGLLLGAGALALVRRPAPAPVAASRLDRSPAEITALREGDAFVGRLFKTIPYTVLGSDVAKTTFDPADPRGYPYLAKFSVKYTSAFGEKRSQIELACNRDGAVIEMVRGPDQSF